MSEEQQAALELVALLEAEMSVVVTGSYRLYHNAGDEWVVKHYKSNAAVFVGTLSGAIAALKQAAGCRDEA